MYGYIYETTNLINGRKYIGQHKSSYFNPGYKGSGKIIKQAFVKYGWDNFKTVILEECDSLDELNKAEIRWIKDTNAAYSDDYYNIALGGNSRHGPYTEEQRRRISEIAKQRIGEKNPFYGKHHSEETKKKITEANKRRGNWDDCGANRGKIVVNNGETNKYVDPDDIPKGYIKGRKPFTKEHCEAISKSHKGKHLTEETKKKISEAQSGANNYWYGKSLPEEVKKKMSESCKQKYKDSPQLKKDISKRLTDRNLGRVWINNGVKNKFVPSEDVSYYEGKGYQVGRLQKNKWHNSSFFINDGITNKLVHSESEIPEGWVRGMIRHAN